MQLYQLLLTNTSREKESFALQIAYFEMRLEKRLRLEMKDCVKTDEALFEAKLSIDCTFIIKLNQCFHQFPYQHRHPSLLFLLP